MVQKPKAKTCELRFIRKSAQVNDVLSDNQIGYPYLSDVTYTVPLFPARQLTIQVFDKTTRLGAKLSLGKRM